MPRGLDHNLRADRIPVELARVALGENLELGPSHRDRIQLGLQFHVKTAQYGIVLEQMGERLGVGKIVDCDKLYVLAVKSRADHVPADAAEAVDGDFYWQNFLL